MKNSKNEVVNLQTEVNTLQELFYLIEKLFNESNYIHKIIPKGLDAYSYINSIDKLVNKDKDHLEYDAINAVPIFQYVEIGKLNDEYYVKELNKFLIELDNNNYLTMPEDEYMAVEKFKLELNQILSKLIK